MTSWQAIGYWPGGLTFIAPKNWFDAIPSEGVNCEWETLVFFEARPRLWTPCRVARKHLEHIPRLLPAHTLRRRVWIELPCRPPLQLFLKYPIQAPMERWPEKLPSHGRRAFSNQYSSGSRARTWLMRFYAPFPHFYLLGICQPPPRAL